MKKRICIIGNGYVGKSMVKLFEERYIVHVKEINDDYRFVNECDLAVVCVPTSMREDGSCNTSIVEEVIKHSNAPLYLIKSTIPPGTTELISKLYNKSIVFSPEYIGEGSYPVPFWNGIPHPTESKLHEFQIFGGYKEDVKQVMDFFIPIIGPYCKYIQTNSTTAELVKYMENSFLATKVVFCHEFARLAELYGCDYNELRELFLLDGRCERGSTAIFNGKLGYDGKCLPKDIEAIYSSAKENGFESKILKKVMETNKEMREENETKKNNTSNI